MTGEVRPRPGLSCLIWRAATVIVSSSPCQFLPSRIRCWWASPEAQSCSYLGSQSAGHIWLVSAPSPALPALARSPAPADHHRQSPPPTAWPLRPYNALQTPPGYTVTRGDPQVHPVLVQTGSPAPDWGPGVVDLGCSRRRKRPISDDVILEGGGGQTADDFRCEHRRTGAYLQGFAGVLPDVSDMGPINSGDIVTCHACTFL